MRIIKLILLVLLLLALFFVVIKYSIVKNIECNCDKLQYSNIKTNRLYFLVKKDISNILSADKTIDKFNISYRFPNKLKMSIIIKKAIHYFYAENSKRFYGVSSDGYIIWENEKNIDNKVYLEVKDFTFIKNKPISNDLLKMLQTIQYLSESDTVVVKKAKYVSDYVELTLRDKVTVFYNNTRKPEYIAGAVKIILEKASANIQNLGYIIDLRYKNIVLK